MQARANMWPVSTRFFSPREAAGQVSFSHTNLLDVRVLSFLVHTRTRPCVLRPVPPLHMQFASNNDQK